MPKACPYVIKPTFMRLASIIGTFSEFLDV